MSQQDRKRHRDGADLDDSTRRGGSAIFQHIKEAAQQPRTSAAPAASAPMSHAERLRAEGEAARAGLGAHCTRIKIKWSGDARAPASRLRCGLGLGQRQRARCTGVRI